MNTMDITANNRTDLYGTALHELVHALGVSTSNMPIYVGVDGGDFTGENLVSVYGGPVPGAGGHFASNVQSQVWDSDNIISEVLLDPSSTSGVRKYLTEVDAALLRDLGYQVFDHFSPADFDLDGWVDENDLAIWHASYGLDAAGDANGDLMTDGTDFLIWQREITPSAPIQSNATAVPEPNALVSLAVSLSFFLRRRPISFARGNSR